MKLTKLLILGMILLSSRAYSQEEPHRFQEAMARMKAERVSFLTDKLSLTADEAEKFWPVYNEYLSKREELMWGRRQRMPRNFDPEQLTDDQMTGMLNDILDNEVKLAQLKKDYFLKIKEILPVRKVLKLHRVEQEFMNHMLNQIRDNRNPGDPRGEERQQPNNPGRNFPG